MDWFGRLIARRAGEGNLASVISSSRFIKDVRRAVKKYSIRGESTVVPFEPVMDSAPLVRAFGHKEKVRCKDCGFISWGYNYLLVGKFSTGPGFKIGCPSCSNVLWEAWFEEDGMKENLH